MTASAERGEEEKEGSLVVRHVGKLYNKELLAKQRTNVFSPQFPWWDLLCHTTRLPGTVERGWLGWHDIGWTSISNVN